MKGSFSSAAIGLSLAAVISPGVAQTTGNIVGDELKVLTSGRTWAIVWEGRMSVWDFRKDGSVCARLSGSKSGDKCADEGKWFLKGEMVCWELTWLGEAFGVKTACSSVRKISDGHFEMRNEKNQDLSFGEFKVL